MQSTGSNNEEPRKKKWSDPMWAGGAHRRLSAMGHNTTKRRERKRLKSCGVVKWPTFRLIMASDAALNANKYRHNELFDLKRIQ